MRAKQSLLHNPGGRLLRIFITERDGVADFPAHDEFRQAIKERLRILDRVNRKERPRALHNDHNRDHAGDQEW